MYLLDTNVISELRKLQRGKADPAFSAWFAAMTVVTLYASVITLFEIEVGIVSLERRDHTQAAILRNWFDNIQLQMEGRIIALDPAIALRCAKIMVPDPRPLRDAFIGATAEVHGFTLVTRNLRDFQVLSVPVVNPWQASAI